MNEMREKCGVFGVFGHQDAARLTFLGLYALQHRGQESAGIVSSDGRTVAAHRGMGLVADVFREDALRGLRGHIAVGHVRYSTTGSSSLKNAQPFYVEYHRGALAVAHNGNITNAGELRNELETAGSVFQSTMDSEIIVHLIARSKEKVLEDAIFAGLGRLEGAFSFAFMTAGQLIGARDPNGFRPLCLGTLGGAYILSSETCALDLIQARFVREIEPGELIVIDDRGVQSIKSLPMTKPSFCIFEYIYFARPDSIILGESVCSVRKRLGQRLAEEHPVDADIVVPVPDSGNYAGLGYATKSGIPLEMGIVRNHYVGRTFIQPDQPIRDFGVKVKLNPVRDLLNGKRVVLVEDSIVRGTTTRTRIRAIREAGAKEVHMRVTCPPLRFPCWYGIDFPSTQELVASGKKVQEVAHFLGLDSLGYLSLDGMLDCMGENKDCFCTACYTGVYPVGMREPLSKEAFETNLTRTLV